MPGADRASDRSVGSVSASVSVGGPSPMIQLSFLRVCNEVSGPGAWRLHLKRQLVAVQLVLALLGNRGDRETRYLAQKLAFSGPLTLTLALTLLSG
jgi:hypothetical protein